MRWSNEDRWMGPFLFAPLPGGERKNHADHNDREEEQDVEAELRDLSLPQVKRSEAMYQSRPTAPRAAQR
jgi:hypothetical protein